MIGIIFALFTRRSQKLRLAEWTLALVALRKPFHYAISVEFLLASLAGLLRKLAAAVDNIEANGALFHT